MTAMGHAAAGLPVGWPLDMNAMEFQPGTPVQDTGVEQTAVARCSAPGCVRQASLEINGQSACSQPCLERLLRSAVIEEQAHAAGAALMTRSRVRIGRILIDQGIISEAQLERALRSQQAAGAGRLGCWLKQQVELPETEFTSALSIQWRCPVFRIGTFAPAEMASWLPRPLAENHGAVPLRVSGSPQRLALAFEDHVDFELVQTMERMLGVGIDPGLLTATEFWQGTRELLGVRFPPVVRVESPSADRMIEAMARALFQANAREARIVAIQGSFWLRFWTGATGAGPAARDVLCAIHGSAIHPEAAEEDAAIAVLAHAMASIG